MSKLAPQHSKAVDGYMAGMTKKAALLEAGYSDSVAATDAHSVFGREDVRAEIQRRLTRISRKSGLTAEWITERLMMVAEANLGDVLAWDEEGMPQFNWDKMNPDLKYALTGVNIRQYMKGRGPSAIPVTEFKPELADKLRALDMLARIMGMYEDKVKVTAEKDLMDALAAGRLRVSRETNEA
jgi:hypothetical protein|tara:strand:+ start:502 stop:1050 length:549 start_codon:yes stop_codon:yes gene_type:complete